MPSLTLSDRANLPSYLLNEGFDVAVVADAGDDEGDESDDSEDDYKDEPERADDEILLNFGDGVIKIDSLGDFEGAE